MNRYYKIRVYTLIELMVVLSVIIILAALLVPTLEMARTKHEKIACTNNLRQIGLLFHSYSLDNNGYIPAPHINQEGNYWSNILYSSYCTGAGLEYDGMWHNERTGEPAPKYIDNLELTNQGIMYEEGTIFHCPAALKSQHVSGGPIKMYTLSYAMNPYLLYDGSATKAKPWLPINTKRIVKPSEAYISMDENANNYMGAFTFLHYSARSFSTYFHDEGRNILYHDGRVNYSDNIDIPNWGTYEFEPFWFGLKKNTNFNW